MKEGAMLPFCKETNDFVSACEKLQFKLMDGGALMAEEKAVIKDSAIGLLGKMKAPSSEPPFVQSAGGKAQRME